MIDHLRTFWIVLASAIAALGGGCVRIAEITIALDTPQHIALPAVVELVTNMLRSVDHDLVNAGEVRWQDLEGRALIARVCRAHSETHCVFAKIHKDSLQTHLSVRVENPMGCFRERDNEWASKVAVRLLQLAGGRGRTIKNSGQCSS